MMPDVSIVVTHIYHVKLGSSSMVRLTRNRIVVFHGSNLVMRSKSAMTPVNFAWSPSSNAANKSANSLPSRYCENDESKS